MNTAVPATPEQRLVEFIGGSAAAIEKAAATEATYEKIAAARDADIPATVDALVRNGRITEQQKTAVVAILKDPVATLELLQKVAEHRNAAEQATLGAPLAPRVKQSSLTTPNLGRTGHQDGIRESDAALFRGLGLAVPTHG